MSRALWHLLARETRAQVRALWRRVRTPRGAVLTVAVAAVLAALLVAQGRASRLAGLGGNLEVLRAWGPYCLLAFVALGILSPRGLYFRPPEVAFLFPAPLPARQLVLYNVLARARVALLSAGWLALFPMFRGRDPFVTVLGYTLALAFLQVTAQWFAVGRAWLGERFGPGVRRIALVAAVALVVGECSRTLGAADAGAIPDALHASPVFGPLGWLTRPFFEAMVAPTRIASLGWSAAAFALLAALVAHLCWMDERYRASAIDASRRVDAARARMRSGGGLFASAQSTARWRVPAPPHLAGAGPVAWRQALELVRNPRGVLVVIVVVSAAALVSIGAPRFLAVEGVRDVPGSVVAWSSIAAIVSASLFFSDNFAFDFRRDLDRMALLKSWPLSPMALAAGQTLPGAAFATLVQAVAIGVVALATDAIPLAMYVGSLGVLAPANWAAVSVDNAFFLLIPYRVVPEDPGDTTFLGRLMLVLGVKLLALAAILAAAIGVFVGVHALSSGSVLAAAVAVAVVLAAACPPLTLLVAWAFGRFDVARDVPG